MNIFETLIAAFIICFCTFFGFLWGVILTIAKQEDERN